MKRLCLIPWLMCLGATLTAQQSAGRHAGLATVLQFSYGGIKADLMAQAERMPEAHYGFRPGTMPDVRTFAEVMMHVADSQRAVCASVTGAPLPEGAAEPALTTKAAAAERHRASVDRPPAWPE